MPSHFSDSDGKSEATLLVQGLVEAMLKEYETFREVLKIPLGVQEVTRDGFRKWFLQADPQLRRQFIQQNGVPRTLELLGPGVLGRTKGGE